MAAIDKLYGTQAQHIELSVWVQQNKPTYLKYLYPFDFLKEPALNRAISSFPLEADVWLLRNCPLEWVVEQIKVQLGVD